MRRILPLSVILLTALGTVVAVACFWGRSQSGQGVPVEGARSTAHRSVQAPPSSTLDASPDRKETQEGIQESSRETESPSIDVEPPRERPSRVKGQVVSAATKQPLFAWLRWEEGARVSSQGNGCFDIDVPEGQDSLILSSRGHRDRVIDITTHPGDGPFLDLSIIELTPRNAVRVRVVDDSGTGLDADVLIVTPSRGRGTSVETTLGWAKDGVLATAFSGRSFLYAVAEDSASAMGEWKPGEPGLTLTVPAKGSRVAVAEEGRCTGREPAALRFDYLGSGTRLVFERRMESDTPDVLPLGAYGVRTESNLASIRECNPGQMLRAGDEWQIELAANSPDVRISLSYVPAPSLRVLDAETGEPLPRAAAWVEANRDEGWQLAGRLASVEPTSDGWLTPAFLRRERIEEGTSFQLTVWSPGYLSEQILDPRGEKLRGESLEVRLTREDGAVGALRVVDSAGESYPGFLHIVVSSVPVPIWSARNAEDGLIAGVPLPAGETVEVRTAVHQSSCRVDVETGEVLDVFPEPYSLTIPTGSIRVVVEEGLDIPITCQGTDGGVYEGLFDAQGWRFPSLPAGAYMVGPEPVVRNLSMRMAHSLPADTVEVRVGQETVVRLNGLEIAPDSITGQIEVVGVEPERLFVSPLHDDLDVPVAAGRDHERFPVSADGSYILTGLELMPTGVLVGYLDGEGMEVPLAIARIDEIPRIECGFVEILVEKIYTGSEFTLLWTPVVHGGTGRAVFQKAGRTGVPVFLGPIPEGTTSVQIIGHGLHDLVSIEVVAEKTTRVTRAYE